MAKPKIAVLAGEPLFQSFFNGRLEQRLAELGHWRLMPRPVVKQLAEYDALITTWDSPRLEEDLPVIAPSVRFIAHCGGEVKRRFAPELFSKLMITNAAVPMARPTAELGAALLLSCARNIPETSAYLRRRSNKIYHEMHEQGLTETLFGREIGLIGFGRIGRALVNMMQGFDLCWRIYDPYADDIAAPANCSFHNLEGVLRGAHLLVLAAASTPETKKMLDAERLALLPNDAAVINIARGALIDLPALTEQVLAGRLRCALDVTDPDEPLPVDHPLRRHPRALMTPHIAGGGRSVRHEIAEVVLDSIERHFAGLPPLHRVTLQMLERMT